MERLEERIVGRIDFCGIFIFKPRSSARRTFPSVCSAPIHRRTPQQNRASRDRKYPIERDVNSLPPSPNLAMSNSTNTPTTEPSMLNAHVQVRPPRDDEQSTKAERDFDAGRTLTIGSMRSTPKEP